MATISNIAVRQITCNGSGAITWGTWSTDLVSFRSGKYNDSTYYVAQVRFRVSAPCTSVKLRVRGYSSNAYGKTYWKASSVESDTTLAKASYQAGQSYDATSSLEGEYSSQDITISGNFKANTDYYLYGFHYTTDSWSAVYMYALYDSTYYTKPTSATEATAYSLTISAGANAPITVKRNSSNLAGTGTLSNGAAIYSGDKLQITFSASTGYNVGTHTVNGSTFTSGNTHTVSGAVKVVSTATVKSFKLTISAGTGSTITVNRTSSPKQGASTGNLSNGATIYYSDVLKVTFSASTGYNLSSTSHTSGSSVTVTGAVTVSATASLKTFTLTISASSGGSVTVSRTSSSGGSTGALSNGATLYYGDKLSVTITPDSNYEATTATLNGTDISSGDTHTVAAAVSVIVVFEISAGLIFIFWDEQFSAYYIYIYFDGWGLYSPYIYSSSGWELYVG